MFISKCYIAKYDILVRRAGLKLYKMKCDDGYTMRLIAAKGKAAEFWWDYNDLAESEFRSLQFYI